ncbi:MULTISPECIES: hypothetical protein [Brucella]|jgi:hypothetical protein|uniref:Uncharacterized protein n=2 Tax=Brucella TaxID=234 RepID=A0A256GTP5_9HYPH|nr:MULTISPECIES: hypothetical protein [Brucella]KAB2704465.1 hypothetical protein F9L03_07430 [Brucella lupini]KAB2763217.1 hypothetical protein F9L04_21020 [Brucella anthropi]OYR30368.1 hypothetical protein CES86_1692 [Brucella lupini]
MQLARGIRSGCWITGLAVGLLAYLILLQGLASAYAKTVMIISPSAPVFVICAPSGNKYSSPDNPLGFLGKDCCAALCKSAASSGPTVPPVWLDLLALIPHGSPGERMQPLEKGDPPDILVVPSLGARAPPSFFI